MSTKTLPDEQTQIEDENRKEEPELQTMERAEELASQFEEVKQRTVGDGMVLGRVKDINTSTTSSTVLISIDLPAEGSEMTKRFKQPKVWSDDYKFVRWIRHYGYTADSFPSMLEDKCKVKVEKGDGKYEVVIPEKDVSVAERVKSFKQNFSVPLGPLPEWYFDNNDPDIAIGLFIIALIGTLAVLFNIFSVPLGPIQEIGAILITFVLIVVFGIIEHNLLAN